MFKRLFGKKEKDPLQGEIDTIASAFNNKRFDEVISRGEPIVHKVGNKNRMELLRSLAISYFQTNNFEKAIVHFEKLSQGSDNPEYIFNLSTCHILNREEEKGLDALERAIELYQTKGKRENTPVSFMIFYAMCALIDVESYDLAYKQLDRLSTVYREISVTDNQFLHSRGYVPFSHLLEKIKQVMENIEFSEAIDWLVEFSSTLDENGQFQIDSMIEDLKAENKAD